LTDGYPSLSLHMVVAGIVLGGKYSRRLHVYGEEVPHIRIQACRHPSCNPSWGSV
jgi:hypothetical protein